MAGKRQSAGTSKRRVSRVSRDRASPPRSARKLDAHLTTKATLHGAFAKKMALPRLYGLYAAMFVAAALIVAGAVVRFSSPVEMAFSQSPAGATSGAVGNPPSVAGEWLLDGGSANDTTSNANNGTVTGATKAPSRNGIADRALSFNGTASQYVTIPDSNSLDVREEITVEAWINPRAFKGHQAVLEKVATDTAPSYMMYTGIHEIPGKKTFRPHVYAMDARGRSIGWVYGAIDFAVTENQWYHVAYTFKSSTGEMKGYVNGKEYPINFRYSALKTDAQRKGKFIKVTSAPLLLGKSTRGGVGGFNGVLDNLRVYNRALSAAEIAALAQAAEDVPPVSAKQAAAPQSGKKGAAVEEKQKAAAIMGSGASASTGTGTTEVIEGIAAPTLIASPERLDFYATEGSGAQTQTVQVRLSDDSAFPAPSARRAGTSPWLSVEKPTQR